MKSKQKTILYSCYYKENTGREQLVEEHALTFIQSGAFHFTTPEGAKIFTAGDIVFVRRNQLAKVKKIPGADGSPIKSVSIYLTQNLLRHYAVQKRIGQQAVYNGQKILRLSPNVFFDAYFQSLLPYYDHPEALTDSLMEIKTSEAVELLQHLGNNVKSFLFDFSEPHKIDLETFMLKNFEFNVPMKEFARLSGRSISTFKRDFQKTFENSPEKWLRERRLDKAYHLIKEKNQKPSEVYIQLGFENFSHFSTAFKEQYGFSPSSL